MISMKKGIWFAFTAVVAMTMMYTGDKATLSAAPRRVCSHPTERNHENKNFNSFPIDNSEREFDDWLS